MTEKFLAVSIELKTLIPQRSIWELIFQTYTRGELERRIIM